MGLGVHRERADRDRRADRREVPRARRRATPSTRRSTGSARCCRSSGSARWSRRSSRRPPTAGPSPLILAGFALALVGLVGLRRSGSCTRSEPMLDVRFFRNPRFTSATSDRHAHVLRALRVHLPRHAVPAVRARVHARSRPACARCRSRRAMMVVAPLSSKAVEWLGTKRVVVTGMLRVRVGPGGRVDITVSIGYPRVGIAMILHGRRHGPRHAARDRVDHGLAAEGAGRRGLRGERHQPRGRRRAGCRRARQHADVDLRARSSMRSCRPACPARCARRPTSRSAPRSR